MAYCPECGEKISDTDTFCAFCGISLQPVALAGATADASATISPAAVETAASAQSPFESKEMPTTEDVQPSAPASEKPSYPPIGFGFNPFADSQGTEESEKITADHSGVGADETDGALRTEPKAEGQQNAAPETPSQRAESPAAISEPVAISEPLEPTLSAQMPSREDAEPDEPFIFESEADSQPAAPGIYPSSAQISSDEIGTLETAHEQNLYNAEFEQTVPYMPADFLKKNAEATPERPPEDSSRTDVSPADESDASVPSFSSMPTPNRREAISMPNTPIESSPHDSIEPKLVSVNILPDFAESAKKSGENEFASAPLPAAPDPAPANEKQARSHTSPNIGMTETDGKKSAKLKPLEEGTILNGRYEIVRKIGGGGMGAVYLASDRNLGGVLRAVKEMVQSYIEDAQQEKAVSDFRRESLLLTSLEHPSIPTIFDYFYDDKECRFYLVMKYISGGDLAARLKSAPGGRIEEKIVTEWAIQIADVLDYLHNRQPPIVYRDLKPSNVMIDGNSGRVMIIDFGIARWVNKEEKGVTAVGTMGYAPPELFSGNVEPRSDIYSLGSTMFHLMTGADPQSNPLLIFDFHKNPRPRQINSGLSDQIEQILVRTVEYNAEHRFKSAAELREALTAHLENLKKGAVTYGAGESAPPAPAVASQPVFCGFCGQKILVTDLFCPFCGAQQPTAAGGAAQSATLKPAFAAAKQTARLLIIGTNELDAPQFRLEKDNSLVGRRDPMSNIFPEVDLSKFDPQTKISRRHARIWREGASFMLEDLGSSNGTVLMSPARESQRLLPHQPHVLTSGDKIRVGDTMLHFFVG